MNYNCILLDEHAENIRIAYNNNTYFVCVTEEYSNKVFNLNAEVSAGIFNSNTITITDLIEKIIPSDISKIKELENSNLFTNAKINASKIIMLAKTLLHAPTTTVDELGSLQIMLNNHEKYLQATKNKKSVNQEELA